jgi:hypothetical protein
MFVGGVKLTYRSMRASWTRVKLQIDGSTEILLRQSIPQNIELVPGAHTVLARGRGFNSANRVIQIDETSVPIIVISPADREGVTTATPLGTLSIFEASDMRKLQPYVFYRGLPTSFGKDTVLHSVYISMFVSAAIFLVGLGFVALIPFAFVEKGIAAGFLILVFGSAVSSILMPAGLGGFVIGLRFLRLPLQWRKPSMSRPDF